MSVDRMTRINALLRREIGEALFPIMQGENFDLAAVTVTQVTTSRDLREARVMISIRGHEGERQRMLRVLERHRPELQSRINRDLGLKYTPRLLFKLDPSIEKGDRVLGLLLELDQQSPAPAQEPDATAGGESADEEQP